MLPGEGEEGGTTRRAKAEAVFGRGSIIQCQIAKTRSDLCHSIDPRSNLSRSYCARSQIAKTRGVTRIARACVSRVFFYPDPSRYISRYVASAPIIDILTEAINATWKKKVINCEHDRRKYRRQTRLLSINIVLKSWKVLQYKFLVGMHLYSG